MIGNDIVGNIPEPEPEPETITAQGNAEQQAQQQPTEKPFDWTGLILKILAKHPGEVKSLVKDLDPEARTVLMALLEKSNPLYAKVARMYLGDAVADDEEESEDDGEDEYIDGHNTKLPKSTWREIIAYMVELHDDGFTPKRIADAVFDDYGIELAPIAIMQYINQYKSKKQPKKDWGKLQKILDENRNLKTQISDIKDQMNSAKAWGRTAAIAVLCSVLSFAAGKMF